MNLNFKYGNFPTIPTVFDESLTYLQQIELLYKTVEYIKEYVDNFENNSNVYTDEQIKLLKDTVITDLQKQITQNNENINIKVDTQYKTITDEYIKYIQKIYDDLIIYIDNGDKQLYDKITTDIIEVKLLIENTKNELIDYVNNSVLEIKVLNPVTGDYDTIQNTIEDIANLLKNESVTAGVYDSLQVTAIEYDSLNISAFNYDFYASRFLN